MAKHHETTEDSRAHLIYKNKAEKYVILEKDLVKTEDANETWI